MLRQVPELVRPCSLILVLALFPPESRASRIEDMATNQSLNYMRTLLKFSDWKHEILNVLVERTAKTERLLKLMNETAAAQQEKMERKYDLLAKAELRTQVILKMLRFRLAIFKEYEVSAKYGGKRFLLSQHVARFNLTSALAACKQVGGDFPNFANARELFFVHTFVQESGRTMHRVYTGAHSADGQHDWRRYGKEDKIKFLQWDNGEPSSKTPPQLCMDLRDSGLLGNTLCEGLWGRFLCEVPASKAFAGPR